MKKLKTNESTSIQVHQMESSWNTIIINQLPLYIDRDKLFSLFSQYGIIDDTYLCQRACPFKNPKHERIARIIFRDEKSAWQVWEDAKKKLIQYDDHVLTITVVSDNYSPIQNLPDTCLREIFDRVNLVKDKFNMEMVCKQWKANGRSTWSNITEVEYNKFRVNTWRVILDRVGKLEGIHLRLDVLNEEQVLGTVTEHCTDLKKLSVAFYQHYGVRINYEECIPRIGKFIEQNKNLERIKFYTHVEPLELDLVEYLMKFFPAGLVEIDIISHQQIIPLTLILSKFKNLRVLKLSGVIINNEQWTDDVMVTLERLEINCSKIPQSIISQILKNNKGLKYLNIATASMSDETFAHVRQLEKLQVLVLLADRFNDVNLGGLAPTLKALCYWCRKITEQGVQAFFDSASDIKKLKIKCDSAPFNFISIARRWIERTGKFLELTFTPNLFAKYPELEGFGWKYR